MRHRFLGDDGLGFCQLALIVSLHRIVITNGEVSGFNKRPGQIFVTVLFVTLALVFTVRV